MVLADGVVRVSACGIMLACWHLATVPAFGEPRHRPLDDMHGGCASFQIDLRVEMEAMKRETQRLAAWPARGDHASRIAVLAPVTIALLPFNQAALSVAPKRPSAYAGMVPFLVSKAGRYRISTGSPAWIEVTANGRRVEPEEFEMQTHCAVLFKTVVYPLDANVAYWLELSAMTRDVTILLSEHRSSL